MEEKTVLKLKRNRFLATEQQTLGTREIDTKNDVMFSLNGIYSENCIHGSTFPVDVRTTRPHKDKHCF